MALPNYRIYPVNMTAGVPVTLNVSGRFVRIITGSERFALSLNGQSPLSVYAGQSLPQLDEDVTTLQISPLAGALIDPHFIEIAVGNSDFRDDRLFMANGLAITPPTGFSDLPDVSVPNAAATLIAAANAARKEIMVSNLSAGASFRLGGATVAAARGLPLGPGSTVILSTSAAVYAYQASGAAASLALITTQ